MLGNQILPYSFKDMEVRTIQSDNGEPLFVVKDICEALSLSNVGEAIKSLFDDELTSEMMMSGGQNREMKFVNESGLYHLIFKSRKEEAQEFRKWVTSEVLPSIRKTGGYVDMNRLEEFMNATMMKFANGLSFTPNKRRSGAPLSDNEKELIITLYKDMYSINAISREIACDRGAVSRFLKQIRKERGVA